MTLTQVAKFRRSPLSSFAALTVAALTFAALRLDGWEGPTHDRRWQYHSGKVAAHG
ncbi:MAG: hypothetical protein ACR2L2_03205 [Acidobacteriota bacterium]